MRVCGVSCLSLSSLVFRYIVNVGYYREVPYPAKDVVCRGFAHFVITGLYIGLYILLIVQIKKPLFTAESVTLAAHIGVNFNPVLAPSACPFSLLEPL